MNNRLILTAAIFVWSHISFAQTTPALPNTSSIITCFPNTGNYTVKTVGPVGRDYNDLQLAIDDAQSGSVLVLDAGAIFSGSFSLPDKTGTDWIIITSSSINLLPQQEIRINPAAPTGNIAYPTQRDAMPKIITTNLSGLPSFYTQANAHHYRLVGLEISIDTTVTNSYGLVVLGDASSSQNTLSLVPHDIIVDRCYIHGHTNATVMKGGVILNCANSAILDSYISDFHSIGYDTYAIAGTNGPGPFKIINNYLEAAGENILFGGGAASIPNLVPSDIEIRNNYFFKPFSWRVGHPNYAGKHWTIKNLFELKTGLRVLLDGNVLENSWADLPTGQSGYAILLTVRAENGLSPQADVSDITITNNIIRHAGAGISLSGHDDQAVSLQSKRIKIANNLFDDIDGPVYGDGNINGPNDGTFLKIGDPSDVIIDHNTIFQTGPVTWVYDTVNNFVCTNNIVNCFLSAGGYQGIYGPGFAHGGNGPMGAYFPDVNDTNQHFHKNVLIGGDSARYSNYNSLSQNYFPLAAVDVNFVDYINGHLDYHNFSLSNSSNYKNFGSDGKDIGVDFVQLDVAMTLTPGCSTTGIVNYFHEDDYLNVYPNPFHTNANIKFLHELINGELIIYDLQGRELEKMKNIYESKIVLSRANLSNGIYFFRLIEGDRISIRKFIVE